MDRFINDQDNSLPPTSQTECDSDNLIADQTNDINGFVNEEDDNSQRTTLEGVGQDNLIAGQSDHVDGLYEIDNKQIIEEDDKTMEELVPSRNRTRIVKPPTHYQC